MLVFFLIALLYQDLILDMKDKSKNEKQPQTGPLAFMPPSSQYPSAIYRDVRQKRFGKQLTKQSQ